jgi:transposase
LAPPFLFIIVVENCQYPTFLDLRLKNFEFCEVIRVKYFFFTKGVHMSEVSEGQIQTAALDHLGLVAAICKDLKIAQRIDDRLPCNAQRKVSPGRAIIAMILNGLGFTNRRLYLTSQFFESKAVERLLGPDVSAKDITDYTLGHALDDIAEYGSSKLFAEVAFGIAIDNNLLENKHHLDTTSFLVHGTYEVNDDSKTIEVVRGFSKDHRPDLKQIVLSLVVNGSSSIPLWMDPLDGNSSDKVSFHDTIKKVESFRMQIDVEGKSKWIADAALYTKERLLKSNDYVWVTRVPENIKEAKALTEKLDEEIAWIEGEEGYKTAEYKSFYGGIEQRWLLVFSKQAFEKERKTLEKKLEREERELKQVLWHFGNQKFHCEQDARKAFERLNKKYKLHKLTGQVVAINKHIGRGRPKKGSEKVITGYRMDIAVKRNQEEITNRLNKKGRFILATNELDAQEYKNEQILREYKEQQNVERGFQFLKDPWFMLDSVFLKLPSRVEALMMVMTLCLLVYNVGQYKLRQRLKEDNVTLPNQLGKEIFHPTLKWIFQMMEGIGVVYFYDASLSYTTREVITNVSQLRKKIIWLFGGNAAWIYGLY